MGFFDTLKKNKNNIFSYIIIILFIACIIALYIYSKTEEEPKKMMQIENKSQDNMMQIENKSKNVDFNGKFGNHYKANSDKINIDEYMNDSDELISNNKKYKVKFINGMLYLVNNVKQIVLRTLDLNVRFQSFKPEQYNYTDVDKKIINNGIMFIKKSTIDNTRYSIRFTILNKDGKVLELSDFGNEKSSGYIKLDDCGNLIFFIDDVEKIDIFNLVELRQW